MKRNINFIWSSQQNVLEMIWNEMKCISNFDLKRHHGCHMSLEKCNQNSYINSLFVRLKLYSRFHVTSAKISRWKHLSSRNHLLTIPHTREIVYDVVYVVMLVLLLYNLHTKHNKLFVVFHDVLPEHVLFLLYSQNNVNVKSFVALLWDDQSLSDYLRELMPNKRIH